MKTLGVALIVKNEEKIIERCLSSVKGIVDKIIICDTGSTDSTIEKITNFAESNKIFCEIYHTPWKNFGWNRTELLKLSKHKTDYLLLLDADEQIEVKNFDKEKLTAKAYYLRHAGGLDYAQVLLIDNHMDWYFVGVTHEYINTKEEVKEETLDSIIIHDFSDGKNRENKGARDIELLQQGLKEEPNSTRYHFYLAQTYKDLGQYEKAIEYYVKRITLKGWAEEVYYSMYALAYCEEKLDNIELAKSGYLAAWEFRPVRAEALYHLALLCRLRKEYQQAYLFAKKALEIPYPKDILFINRDVYEYELLFEKSISAYYIGKYQEAYDECKKIMTIPGIPESIADQNKKNIQFSEKKLFGKVLTNTYDTKFESMTEQEKEQQVIEIKELEQLFKEQFGLQLYPIYGTLLGIIRDNDFIGHDYDLDLAYISKYHTKKEILKELDQICDKLSSLGLLEKRFSFNGQLHVMSPSKKQRIDIWTSWIENGKYYLTYTIDGEISGNQVLPLKPITFKGQKLQIPCCPEGIFEVLYCTWKTPLKDNFAKAKWVFRLQKEE